jgi:hypothetical protein
MGVRAAPTMTMGSVMVEFMLVSKNMNEMGPWRLYPLNFKLPKNENQITRG